LCALEGVESVGVAVIGEGYFGADGVGVVDGGIDGEGLFREGVRVAEIALVEGHFGENAEAFGLLLDEVDMDFGAGGKRELGIDVGGVDLLGEGSFLQVVIGLLGKFGGERKIDAVGAGFGELLGYALFFVNVGVALAGPFGDEFGLCVDLVGAVGEVDEQQIED